MNTPDVRPVGDLPDEIGKTAARELSLNGITSLKKVSAHTEKDLLAIHDVEPKAIRILRDALANEGLAFESGQA
jgi:predicted flap endonuclease-1-like 5' DNA nuclease